MRFKRRTSKKAKYHNSEFGESFFIPYLSHWDENVILTKEQSFLICIKLDGFIFETADDEDLEAKKTLRNTLFKSVTSNEYAIWFHTVRKRKEVSLQANFNTGFASQLDKKWQESRQKSRNYVNELYITIVVKEDKSKIGKVENFFTNLNKQLDKDSWEFDLKTKVKELKEFAGRVMATLREYNPRILGIQRRYGCCTSEVLNFLGMLTNCGYNVPYLLSNGSIASYLPNSRLYFGKKTMEARHPDGSRTYGGIIGVREYGNSTNTGMMDGFLHLPFEFIISQSFSFIQRQDIIGRMSLQQRRMISAKDKGVSQAQELSVAMDMAMSGLAGFGNHHLSILALSDDIETLEDKLSMCHGEFISMGIIPVREGFNMQPSYWAQLPGNFKYITRPATLSTLNLASFASLHNYPTGKKDGNHWGQAVTIVDTSSGTPYFFNFHLKDVGHTVIIGPTGAGKTVLMNFLLAQAQKFNAKLFFFDKDRGAEIFIRALGGHYSDITPGEKSSLNPLQLKDSPRNRAFLAEWMASLIQAIDKTPINAGDMERIKEAIEGSYRLEKHERKLSNIAPFLGLEGPNTLAGRLKTWHGEELRAGVFDNDKDELDLKSRNIYGFEMGAILQDKISLEPVLLYLFERIQNTLDGTPTLIVLDEAWALIDNEIFAPKIKDWLKTLRKLNASVIFATQSVEDASKSVISDTLVQQTATQIFLPNPKATEEYKKSFLLSDREFILIRSTPIETRYFLLKQGTEVVVARIDLSQMGDIIAVLSGRADTVRIMQKIIEKEGENPKDWLPVFFSTIEYIEKMRKEQEIEIEDEQK